MRLLSKSRFKLGLECPNKLYYTGKKEYPNKKSSDPFLQALAQGGFQVEELARLHYPGGKLIEDNDWDYELLWNQTQELLQQENVTIFEAAFMIDGLFVRTDILVKTGNEIQLIEVKSKSFDPADEYIFIGKQGGVVSKWKPYLFDIAFQKHVMQACFPNWKIKSSIMMADKSKTASIDGLNQLFRITNKESGRTGIIKKVKSLSETGESILGVKDVTDIVSQIEEDKFKYYENLGFYEAIELFQAKYSSDEYINWPTSYSACRKCEFRYSTEELKSGEKSGFKECFETQHKWLEGDFKRPNTFDIYDFRRGQKLLDRGVIFKENLSPEDIGLKEDPNKLTTSHRQWLQIEKEVNNDKSIFTDISGLREEMESWTFPLHFIDFETSTVALPFYKGMRPYEQVAFQFSHHVYEANGQIVHADQYINGKAGFFPNFEFIRELKSCLEKDQGTIFRYADHENSILNAIYIQLQNSQEEDRVELIEFIQSISHSKKDSSVKWKGERDMVDLWDLEKRFYYNPLTKGSNSIKDVLPAALASSNFLQDKYSQSLDTIGVSSMNFQKNHVWITKDGDHIANPYKNLPALYENWTDQEIEEVLSEMEEIHDGGAALTAYARLQYTDMKENEIDELTNALLKYCELDTLAMVMVYEHFKEITKGDA